MSALDGLRGALGESARDIKLNAEAVLRPGALSPAQRWGVAVASAAAARHGELLAAVIADARVELPGAIGDAVVDDALAAASLMAMNNVYYRFRHLVGQPAYAEKPARLRMNRLARPAGRKVDLELFSLAASAINGCGTCMQAHERAVREGGLGEDEVHDAVRIAATVQALAVALESAAAGASISADVASAG